MVAITFKAMLRSKIHFILYFISCEDPLLPHT